MSRFEQIFGMSCESQADAPGRVNMLGEHTDYNDGFVLPTTIWQRTRVMLSESPDGHLRVASAQLSGDVVCEPGASAPGFMPYLSGCIEALRARGHRVPAACVYVDSQVPIGVGLSSSAALEVATLRALRARYELPIDNVEIARIGQAAEVDYAGVRCGIMDQMAASLGEAGQMLFLDTRSLDSILMPLPEAATVCVFDSGVPRTLAGSAFNQRRLECEQSAHALGVAALRDVCDVSLAACLPPPLDRRARHVISENARVLRAAEGLSADEFGRLMNDSHTSLRDDFAVSVPALDALVDCLQRHPAVFGARLTGAGFGGACVALVRAGDEDIVTRDVLDAYRVLGHRGSRLV